ncbi:MAG: Rpn family recombination-promoting nuclease/putative transposase [Lachnospiraceae bacterium]|nr:Rpn family recombination-promoting nuclease/putative transposase [Lachnospiraceae bacterium]
MGEIHRKSVESDPTMKDYWRNSRRFADLINGSLFEGREVVRAEELSVHDTDESAITAERNERIMTIKRNRDIVKMSKSDAGFVLLALENQQKIHSYMPLRIATYDILDYVNQERMNKTPNGPFRLIPIYTLVIYYGETRWNGATSLSELMEIPEEMKPYVNDWHCKVIQVRSYDKDLFHDEEVRSFFDACQRLYQMKHVPEVWKGLYLSQETAVAVGVATGTKKLIELAERHEEGKVDMCKAFDDFLKEREDCAREQGWNKGQQEGVYNTNLLAIQNVMKALGISAEKAMQILKIAEDERAGYLKKL